MIKSNIWMTALSALTAGILTVSAIAMADSKDITQFFSDHGAEDAAAFDHSVWDNLLAKYVVASDDGVNRVDYTGWQDADHKPLKAYVNALQAFDPRTLSRSEQFAYWANLYNAKTIDIILDNYPIDSIRKISINEGLFGYFKESVGAAGPWKAKIIKVAGHTLSLDDIEHIILRPIFKDPRVHYAVNCASFGCPNLSREALTGAKLDTQLDAGATAFINHPRGFSIEDGNIKASSIYQWFQGDFGGSEKGVLDHARKYADDTLKAKLEGKNSINDYGYDWSLNNIQRGS